MPDPGEHDSDLKPEPKLATALKDLHKARIFVTPEVDEVVLAKARKHLEQLPKREPGRRPLLPWAALAASFVIGAWLVHTLTRPAAPTASFAGEDINRDRRVDILDAFALARQIESGGTLDARWDITGDGRINRADVDAIATRAVNLGGAAAADVRRLRREKRAEANHSPSMDLLQVTYNLLSHMQQKAVRDGSGSRCVAVKPGRLSMNLPFGVHPLGCQRGRSTLKRGHLTASGSRPQLTSKLWRCFRSMNRLVCGADCQSAVSQVGKLQAATIHSPTCRLPIGETADCQSALPDNHGSSAQCASLRHCNTGQRPNRENGS